VKIPQENSISNPEHYMQRAIQLALKADNQTEPNPIVGAVLVDGEGNVVSKGYHKKAGTPHAEVVALKDVSDIKEDATLFVTLEPCSHFGKTPPCTDLIIQKKIKHVVVGCQDPNPIVAGRGIKILRENGISVKVGVCETECRNMNRVFNKHIVTQLPYVTIKSAISLDGKISMPSGESQWITGDKARAKGHLLRSRHQAIAVGSQTLKTDNPTLTDRISKNPRQPIRVVFSSSGIIQTESKFAQIKDTQRIILAGNIIDPQTVKQHENNGIVVHVADSKTPTIEWGLRQLYAEGICSLLLEGGGKLIASFLKEKMADQLYLFLSGKIIGGAKAPAWSGEIGVELLKDVPQINFSNIEKVGEDLLITGFFDRF